MNEFRCFSANKFKNGLQFEDVCTSMFRRLDTTNDVITA